MKKINRILTGVLFIFITLPCFGAPGSRGGGGMRMHSSQSFSRVPMRSSVTVSHINRTPRQNTGHIVNAERPPVTSRLAGAGRQHIAAPVPHRLHRPVVRVYYPYYPYYYAYYYYYPAYYSTLYPYYPYYIYDDAEPVPVQKTSEAVAAGDDYTDVNTAVNAASAVRF